MTPRRTLGWLATFLCLGLALWTGGTRARGAGQAPRLLGPLADLAARVQWVRFQRARLAGYDGLALSHARDALWLDARNAQGWELVASHLALFLGSLEREPVPEKRLYWFRAALQTLEEGRSKTDRPEQLWFTRGLLFRTRAEFDPTLPWPGGLSELWREAARSFEHAASGGVEGARELALDAQSRAPD